MQQEYRFENQFTFYEQKSKDVFTKALAELKAEYEAKDWEIFHSRWRKNQGYIPHGTRKRTIITIFGNLTYARHRYRHWDKDRYKYVYLSDLALGVEKYQRITNHLQVKILSLIAEGKRYRDILDCFPNVNFHCRTISNIIDRAKINSFTTSMLDQTKKVAIDKCLYINVDDTFLTFREKKQKKKYRIRAVLFHTGYDWKKSTKNKKVLKNKRIYFFLLKQNSKMNTAEFMADVYSLAKDFYLNVDQAKVIIAGDGAPWIRECNKYWPGSIYILDKFHAIRKIRNVYSPNADNLKPTYQLLKTLFSKGNYHKIMTILDKNPFKDPIKILRFNDLKSYLQRNQDGIENQSYQDNLGCSIENAISHHLKWLLGYGSKAFSKRTYAKMLDIHMAKVNGISIIDLLRERIITKLKEKNQFFKENYWRKSFISYAVTGEMPIAKAGTRGRWYQKF